MYRWEYERLEDLDFEWGNCWTGQANTYWMVASRPADGRSRRLASDSPYDQTNELVATQLPIRRSHK